MKWQETWETPEQHLKVHFFILSEIFRKLFYIDELSRRDVFLIFRLEHRTMTCATPIIKAGRWKKKGGKRCWLSSHLHTFDITSVTQASCYLCCMAATVVVAVSSGNCPAAATMAMATGHQPWLPRTTCTDGFSISAAKGRTEPS